MTPPNLRRFTVTETREAVEVTADNLDEVAAWCGGTVQRPSFLAVLRWGANGRVNQVVKPGRVLVTDGSRWWDVPRAEFERASEQWTEETM